MSNLWVDIETLVLDGVPMDATRGGRIARLAEMALTRLLEQRGTAARIASIENDQEQEKAAGSPPVMRVPASANEARWAEELAMSLYRAMDRTL